MSDNDQAKRPVPANANDMPDESKQSDSDMERSTAPEAASAEEKRKTKCGNGPRRC
ncbi:MAG: hypothetical protein K0Q94_204 [Paenibacillus sp.]|nr:hypothetical protein [Paenibacillus sp.]